MEEKNIYFEDNSGDKKYFTMLPNIILNHSTAVDQALYCQLKKHAGENGICFVSERNLMEKLGVGRFALQKSFKYLLGREWIKYEGLKDVMSQGGVQKVKSYSVVDIWGLNLQNYQGAVKTTPLSDKVPLKQHKVPLDLHEGVLIQPTNKNPLIKTEEDNTFLSLEKKYRIRNTDTNNLPKVRFSTESEAQEYMYSKKEEWKDFIEFLVIEKE